MDEASRSEGLMTDTGTPDTPAEALTRRVESLCDDFSPEAVAAEALRVAENRAG